MTDAAGHPARMLGPGQEVTEQKVMEDARDRLATLADVSDDAIVTATLEGVIETWNHGAQQLYGYTAAEALGQSIMVLAAPDRAGEIERMLASVSRGARIETVETVRVTKHGKAVDVSMRIASIDDVHGTPIGVSSISRAITGQKLLEARLRDSSRHFEVSRDLTVTVSLDGRFESVNPALVQILGWSSEEFLGRHLIDFVHPEDRDATARELRRLGEDEAGLTFVNRYQAKDGSYRWLDWNAILAPEEGLLYCAARDVSDRRRVDAALSASESRTRGILETAHDAFVAVDESGLVTEWNRQAVTMFGWTKADALGRDLAEMIIPSQSRGVYRSRLKRAVAGDSSLVRGAPIERSVVRRDGHPVPVEVSLSRAESEQGCTLNMFLRDITERRRAREELALARDEAVEASRLKSLFVANVSHEIRTPMNGVIGMSGLLLDTSLDDQQREFVQMLISSGEAVLDVIDDILDFSKIEAGRLDLDPTEFDPRDAIEKVCGTLATRAHQKGLELAVAIDDDLPASLHGDVARVRQAIANLVSNAIKFTETGEVVVRVSSARPSDDPVLVRVAVSDTGIGIEGGVLEEMFRPFSQADTSTTRRYGGTGLGLGISKYLIELMGGEVGAESEVGRGSTFWLEIPLGRCPAGSSRPATKRELTGLRVLVVDDNATSRRILHRQLSVLQASCAVAESAADALELLESAAAGGLPYELALLDRHMPETDGFELAREIRARPALSGTRLVLLSSSGGGHGALDQPLLFDRSLTKPVRQSRLHAEIRGVLAGERPTNRPAQTQAIVEAATGVEILVVEDTPINQAIAVHMLEKCGYRARVAQNGRDALDALAERRYAAVLMDCQMPDLDGYETTREIRRSRESWSRVPVIAVTARLMGGERNRCLAAGMDDYLTKPLRDQTLKNVLERWVSEPGIATSYAPESSPPATEWECPPLLDRAVTAEFDLPATRLAEHFAKYFDQASRQLTALSGAIARGDPVSVAREAHTLSGGSGTLGVTRVAQLASELEAAAESGDLRSATKLLDKLRAGLLETRDAYDPT